MRRFWQTSWAILTLLAAMTTVISAQAQASAPTSARVEPKEDDKIRNSRLESYRLAEQGKVSEAIALLTDVQTRLEKSNRSNSFEMALVLGNLGDLYSRQKEYVKTENVYRRALAIREKLFEPTHPQIGHALYSIGGLHFERGEFVQAENLFRRAQAIYKTAGLGPDFADASGFLAVFHMNRAELAEAERLLLDNLAIYKKAYGSANSSVAQTLELLGDVYEKSGNVSRAAQYLSAAASVFKAVQGGDSVKVGALLERLGIIYDAEQNYARAIQVLEEELRIYEKAFGPDSHHSAAILRNIAFVHYHKGDPGMAMQLIQRALMIKEKLRGPNDVELANFLNDYGTIHVSVWNAEPAYQRALEILEKAYGTDSPELLRSIDGLGEYYAHRRDYVHAAPHWERALAIRQKAYGANHPSIATSLLDLAELYEATKDITRAHKLINEAISLYEKKLVEQEKTLGPDHPAVGGTWSTLSRLYSQVGRTTDAIKATSTDDEIADYHATTLLQSGAEDDKRQFMRNLSVRTNFDIWLHMQKAPKDPAAARLAMRSLLRRKARVLDSMAGSFVALRKSSDPKDKALLERLASVYAQIAMRVSRDPGDTPPEQYRQELAQLVQQRQQLESAISERSGKMGVEQRPLMVSDVQAVLPHGAVLVEIARYEPIARRALSHRPNPPRYVAYVLKSAGVPQAVDLGEARIIDEVVQNLRQAFADHDLTRNPKPAARALDRLLMEPIRKSLGDARWIFMSAEGPLHLVPFGALVDEQGRYLVERYLFSYVTTGRDLLRFRGERAETQEAPLVLANPAFDKSNAPAPPEATHRGTRSIDMISQPLLRLGSTVKEANTIHSLFPDSRVLLGAEATEESIKSAHSPRILHLATHGFFLPERPIPETLTETRGKYATHAERVALYQRENPLLRAGIALAGFNQRRSGVDDGVLTALEVAALDLQGTRLVVLSACESGLGYTASGEGVFGLRRALVIAGSETQVMSLWQVDTGRTRELMEAYYRQLKDGAGRSEAMRSVQLAMLDVPATSHPNLWASFIVSGDWRPLEGQERLPDLRVHPSVRGCACQFAGESSMPSSSAISGMVLLGLARRRRIRRTCY